MLHAYAGMSSSNNMFGIDVEQKQIYRARESMFAYKSTHGVMIDLCFRETQSKCSYYLTQSSYPFPSSLHECYQQLCALHEGSAARHKV